MRVILFVSPFSIKWSAKIIICHSIHLSTFRHVVSIEYIKLRKLGLTSTFDSRRGKICLSLLVATKVLFDNVQIRYRICTLSNSTLVATSNDRQIFPRLESKVLVNPSFRNLMYSIDTTWRNVDKWMEWQIIIFADHFIENGETNKITLIFSKTSLSFSYSKLYTFSLSNCTTNNCTRIARQL